MMKLLTAGIWFLAGAAFALSAVDVVKRVSPDGVIVGFSIAFALAMAGAWFLSTLE